MCVGTAITTINGDNIIEALIVIIIAGVVVVSFPREFFEVVSAKIGRGTVPGAFVALALSKITFALARDGTFGNESFR